MKIVRVQKSGGTMVMAVPKQVQLALGIMKGTSVMVQVVGKQQFTCTIVDSVTVAAGVAEKEKGHGRKAKGA